MRSKSIRIKEDLYEAIQAEMKPRETFSQTVKRLLFAGDKKKKEQ